jgi:hypothetical protein
MPLAFWQRLNEHSGPRSARNGDLGTVSLLQRRRPACSNIDLDALDFCSRPETDLIRGPLSGRQR